MASITIRRGSAAAGLLALAVTGCAGRHVSPLAPPPYRAEIESPYDATWRALVKALAIQNVPLRAVARDSGVIASDEIVAPIGLYADCGRIGDDRLEGEAIVSYTLFATPNGSTTHVQVNSKARTQAHRTGDSGKLRPTPVYPCASTGRFELNLLDAVRELVRP
ncbi:MAG: hypothetical protein HYR51_14180 [Candidatus Rokubacteria bacterium]|nr:hypothetical protein [Candidatus Rokubacteria bacterium]